MERRWSLLVCAVPLALAACSSEPASTVAAPVTTSSAPTAVVQASQAPQSRSPAPSPPSTPQQQALAAYERYVEGSVDALAAGAVPGPSVIGARGQALRHLRDRVRANADDGVLATGDLTPSVTEGDVQLDGGTATVTDCVLNGLEHVDADQPGRVVVEATGWRQPVVATIAQRDGVWTVTRVKVPLRDGSGRVPPPPDDPPYLRGPAQGPAPPSCVPPDLAEAAVGAYGAFQAVYDEALGFGQRGAADPNHPELDQVAVHPQLSEARSFLSSLADENRAFRGQTDTHDPWAIGALDNDRLVIVYDCVTVGRGGGADASSTAPDSVDPDAGTYRLDAAEVVVDHAGLRVAAWTPIEEGLDQCKSGA